MNEDIKQLSETVAEQLEYIIERRIDQRYDASDTLKLNLLVEFLEDFIITAHNNMEYMKDEGLTVNKIESEGFYRAALHIKNYLDEYGLKSE